MGTAMPIPSGILCNAMAKQIDIPSMIFLLLTIKVTIPSGILWRIITIIDKIPILKRLLLLLTLSTIFSKKNDDMMPIKREIKQMAIRRIPVYLVFKYLRDSGIKSIIDTQIMTPDAKAHELDIILLRSLTLKNIGNVPSRVAIPARVVKIKGYNI